jgi:hypothetical protein
VFDCVISLYVIFSYGGNLRISVGHLRHLVLVKTTFLDFFHRHRL